MNPEMERFDVAVVGAGSVGLTAALAFARAGFRTCLIGPLQPKSDGRTVALLGASVELLEELRAWPHLLAHASPLRVMRIIDDTGHLFAPPPTCFEAEEIGAPAFGYNIETAALLSGLAEAVQGQRNLSRVLQAVSGVEWHDRPRIVLEDGHVVEADLVVGADGRRSILRQAAGIETRAWSYPQVALTTILSHDGDHGDASTEFHTRFGPFTLVPMRGRRSSLVWVTHPRHADRLSALADSDFAQAVERQAQSMLGAMRLDGPRGRVPIGGLSVDRLFAPGLALIGEAAHVLPPIGAQGLNLGFRDVAALRDIAVKARAAGEAIGSREVLVRYQTARAGDIRLRTGAVDLLNRSLLAQIMPGHLLRGIGMLAVGGIGPLRRAVMRQGLAAKAEPPQPVRRR